MAPMSHPAITSVGLLSLDGTWLTDVTAAGVASTVGVKQDTSDFFVTAKGGKPFTSNVEISTVTNKPAIKTLRSIIEPSPQIHGFDRMGRHTTESPKTAKSPVREKHSHFRERLSDDAHLLARPRPALALPAAFRAGFFKALRFKVALFGACFLEAAFLVADFLVADFLVADFLGADFLGAFFKSAGSSRLAVFPSTTDPWRRARLRFLLLLVRMWRVKA